MAAARPSVDGMAGGAFLEGPASRNGFFIVVRRLSGFSNPTSVSNLLCSTLRFVPGLFCFYASTRTSLAALDAADTRLSFTQSTRPAVLSGAGDNDVEYRYLLMPVRLAG